MICAQIFGYIPIDNSVPTKPYLLDLGGKMYKRTISVLLLLVMLLAFGSVTLAQDEEVTITILTHWGEERTLESQQAMMDEYMELHPNVTLELQTVPFEELLTKIITSRTAGTSPDIYHLYNLWLPEFVSSEMMDVPPQAVIDAVLANAPAGVVEGTTFNDQVWGYPTEVNTYLLLYNKALLAEAGYDAPPATWDELVEITAAITQIDDTGAVNQVGFAVITGWDSGVVHPYSSLLFSNGGDYLSEDHMTVAFDSDAGLETLELYQALLDEGGMDMSISGWDFPTGNIGMIIMANWWRATLQASEDIDYDTEVGVAPVPVGPSGDAPGTVSYNWLWGVDAGSDYTEAAWDYILWMNSQAPDSESSRMGDYLVNDMGAIPSNLFDQEAYADVFGDHFLAPFVESTTYARPEPLIGGSQEIKTMLQTEIEALFSGMTDPQSVLDYVAPEANAILEEFRMMTED
jgi:multiple sugar transport system substrate-binding protein